MTKECTIINNEWSFIIFSAIRHSDFGFPRIAAFPANGVDPALGVDQEGAGGRDPVRGRFHRGPGSGRRAWPEDDLATFEDAGLGLDVDDLVGPGIDHGRLGDAEHAVRRWRGEPAQVFRGARLELGRATLAAQPDFPPLSSTETGGPIEPSFAFVTGQTFCSSTVMAHRTDRAAAMRSRNIGVSATGVFKVTLANIPGRSRARGCPGHTGP